MKKTKSYAKKSLSVFMAIMMLMTAWVFVPGEHNHASAVSASEVSATNSNAVSKFYDSSFNTSFTTVSGNFHGDNASTMASRGYYKNVLYSPHFPASNNNLNNSDAGVYFGNLGGTADGARVWYPETTLIWDGSTTPQIPILFDIDSNNNNRVGVKNVYISSGANGLVFKDSYWTAKSECGKDTNYYTHFTFDWIMQNNSGNYWISTSSGNDKESMCSTKGYWDIYGTYLQYTGGSFGSGSTYYKAITPTWVCRTGSNYTGTTNKTIYVIDYVPLKSALNNVKTLINQVKSDPSKYTTASVSALVSAANKLIAAKPNNYINSSGNDVYGWNSAVSSALSAYNSAKNLTVQQYTLTFKSIDGTIAKSYSYDYGTSINCNSLAPANSVAPIANNDSYHQTYVWDTNDMSATTVLDDITVEEITGNLVAHSFPATATQGDAAHTWTCSVCGYVKSQAHTRDSGTVTQDDTCTESGIITYNCKTCGKEAIATEDIDEITSHDFNGDYVIVSDGENGTHHRKCTRCDAYGAEEAHKWDKGTVTTNAGCLTDGTKTYKCTLCDTATYVETIAQTGHQNVVATEAKDVKNVCGGDGYKAFWTCSDCGKIYKDKDFTEEISEYKFTEVAGIQVPAELVTKGPEHEFTGDYVAISTGADGEHHRQCVRFAVCKTYGTAEAHNYTAERTDSTCSAAGNVVYTCSDCGESYNETLGLAAHTMTKIDAVAATCTADGNNAYYYCEVCKQYFTDEDGSTSTTPNKETVYALGHTFAPGNTDLQQIDKDPLVSVATCQSPAIYSVKCDRCDAINRGVTYTYGEKDTENGHAFDGESKKNSDGTHSYKCTVAGCTEYGKTTDCDYEVTEETASTCTTAGETTYKCKDCGNTYTETKPLDFNNHNGEGTYIIGDIEATCATLGSTGIEKCSGCDAILSTKLNDIPVDPENHENMLEYPGQAATCQQEGWKAYEYCSACDTYKVAKVTIDPVDHVFTTYTSNGDGTHTAICDKCDEAIAAPVTETKACEGGTANCVDKAICSVCKGAYGEVNAANHKQVKVVPEKDSTCQTEGYKAYKHCYACGTDTETVVAIEKKAHEFGAWVSNNDGTHTRSCTKCEDTDTLDVATETEACTGGTANCIEKAKCSVCKTAYGEFDPAAHKTEATIVVGAYEATCQLPGYTGDRYHACCYDAEKEDNSAALVAVGSKTATADHEFAEVSRKDATCIATGEVTYKCTNCVAEAGEIATKTETLPINIKNHASDEEITVGAYEATCESDGFTGNIYHKCCYDENATTEANKKALIKNGAKIKANGQHLYGEALPEYAVELTTEEIDGRVVITSCEVKSDAELEALTYADKVSYRHEDGKWYHVRVCGICEEVVLTPCYTYEHSYNCVDTDICEVCDGICSLVDESRHKDNLVVVEGTAATCLTNGTKDYYECADCGKAYLDEAGKTAFDAAKIIIDKATAAHTYDFDGETVEEVEPTCEEDGYKIYRCTATCKDEAGNEISCTATTKVVVQSTSNTHVWASEYKVTKEATCGTNGYEAIHCTVCDKVKANSYKIIPATGEHTYGEPEKTPGENCVKPGILTYTCAECGYVKTETDTEGVSAHQWGDWTTIGGDCSTGIVQRRTCGVCQASEENIISTDTHEYEIKIYYDANPEQDGLKVEICKNCGDRLETVIKYEPGSEGETDVNKHLIDENIYTVVEKADCHHGEIRRYVCLRCCENVDIEATEPLEHVWLYQYPEDPTCETAGHSEYYRCVRCLAEYDNGKVIYPAIGHADKDDDGRCDACNAAFYVEGEGVKTCNCICHKGDFFSRIIYKILSFFWKLFRSNYSCSCGATHY